MSCNNTKTDTKKDEVTKDAKDNTPSKKGWSADDRKKLMDDCVRKPGSEKGYSNEVCSCYLDKAEAIFSSYNEMKDKGKNNSEFQKDMEDCAAKFSDKKDNDTKDNTQTGWSADENKFRNKECVGISPEHCSCKLQLAEKYSKSYQDYLLLIIKDNDPNSDFWKEFDECTRRYSHN